MSGAERIQAGLGEAMAALRAGRPDLAVAALLRVRPLAAGAGPLPHAAVLVRLAQARLAQSEASATTGEAASRAVQAHAAAADSLRRLAEAGAWGSTLEARATHARGAAAARLEGLAVG